MAIAAADITNAINKAQQRLGEWMLKISQKEDLGEVPTSLYLKARYLSGGILTLSDNNTLTDDEKEAIIECMNKVGSLNELGTIPLSFSTITVTPTPLYPQAWTDLTDTPSSYSGKGCYIPSVKADLARS